MPADCPAPSLNQIDARPYKVFAIRCALLSKKLKSTDLYVRCIYNKGPVVVTEQISIFFPCRALRAFLAEDDSLFRGASDVVLIFWRNT